MITTLVVIMAILLIIEAIIYMVALTQLNRQLKRLEKLIPLLANFSTQALDFANQMVEKLRPLKEQIPALQARVHELSARTDQMALEGDRRLAQALTSLRRGTQEIDAIVDKVLSKFTQQTFRVHLAILSPAIHVSAMIQAMIAGLGKLLDREKRKSPADNLPDQEIFI
ncbi:MAG: hypothetical protein ACRD1R_21370 [Acidobacteriota bacterium]